MQCLNCGIEMMNNQVTTKDSEITYDMCERCGSLWLDRGELDKMAFQVQGSIEFCSDDPAEKRYALDRAVSINPAHTASLMARAEALRRAAARKLPHRIDVAPGAPPKLGGVVEEVSEDLAARAPGSNPGQPSEISVRPRLVVDARSETWSRLGLGCAPARRDRRSGPNPPGRSRTIARPGRTCRP